MGHGIKICAVPQRDTLGSANEIYKYKYEKKYVTALPFSCLNVFQKHILVYCLTVNVSLLWPMGGVFFFCLFCFVLFFPSSDLSNMVAR